MASLSVGLEAFLIFIYIYILSVAQVAASTGSSGLYSCTGVLSIAATSVFFSSGGFVMALAGVFGIAGGLGLLVQIIYIYIYCSASIDKHETRNHLLSLSLFRLLVPDGDGVYWSCLA